MNPRVYPARVTARHVERERVEVAIGPHLITADHPANMGGDDDGPAPMEILLGAVASCKAVTTAAYARRKGYAVESISVHIPSFSYAHETSDGPEHTRRFMPTFLVRLEISGNLTEEQRSELEAVARHCPVSETIMRGVAIDQQ